MHLINNYALMRFLDFHNFVTLDLLLLNDEITVTVKPLN